MYMAVRKPLEKVQDIKVNVEELIDRGAPVKGENKQPEETKKWTYINLRIAVDMVNNVDEAVKERVGITRTGWILEAIHEKLKKGAQ